MKGNNLLNGKYFFWKFSIHKEIFALKADCANFLRSITENFVDWKIFRWTDLEKTL